MSVTSNYEAESKLFTLVLDGHIDSANAAAIEADINSQLEGNDIASMVIDTENLTYLSSVGLRIILRLKKTHKDLKIINVCPEVYDIFDMTGFTEMIDITKAYRVISIDGCEQIGQGSNGVVYRIDPDTIVKVYRNPNSLPDIHRERELARKALVMGIPTAIPYDVVKVGNTYGSVFELLNATSFAKIVLNDPSKLDETIIEFTDLLKQIHSTEVEPGAMPEMKSVALNWAKDLESALSEDQFKKLYNLVENVPERSTMLHGDYHFKNVMVQNGEVLLIDMDTLCTGHPVFEFASVYLANVGFGEVDHNVTLEFMGLPFETTTNVWEKTLELYFGTDDKEKLSEYADKAKVIGYTRLLRRTLRREPDNTAVIDNCKKNLADLLSRVETLDF